MNRKIATMITGVSFLGCLCVFLPSQVLGSDGVYECLQSRHKIECGEHAQCEWLTTRSEGCFGGGPCEDKFTKDNERLCELKAEKYGCYWQEEKGRCIPNLSKKQTSKKS